MLRVLSLIAVAASLNASAAASSPISFLGSLQTAPTLKKETRDATACADFNGSWKGSCVSAQGQKTEEAFTLKQHGCEFIHLTGKDQAMSVPIGGVFSAGGAIPGTPAITFGVDLNSHWNKDQTVLTLQVMGGGKKLAINEAGGGFYVKENARIVNGKMIVDIYAMGNESKAISYCEFEKTA